MRRIALLLLTATSMFPADSAADQATELYRRTEYRQSLAVLLSGPHADAGTLQLIGQNYFMLGDYKKATGRTRKSRGARSR